MNRFYIWTTAAIIILARMTLGITLLHFILTFSEKHAIILFVTWLILGISEFNLKTTIENIRMIHEQNSKKPQG